MKINIFFRQILSPGMLRTYLRFLRIGVSQKRMGSENRSNHELRNPVENQLVAQYPGAREMKGH